MKLNRIFISAIPILLFFISCSDDDAPTNTGNDGPIVLLNTTFEGSGKGDFQGWQFRENDVSASEYFKFSTDVPTNGGSWSLMLLPDTVTRRHLFYKAIPPVNSTPKIMSVKYDLKTVGPFMGTLDCKIWSNSHSDGWSGGFGKWLEWDTSDNLYEITVSNIDSIVFELGMYNGKIGDTLFVDNFKIELYSK
jgi:hypothetical protein